MDPRPGGCPNDLTSEPIRSIILIKHTLVPESQNRPKSASPVDNFKGIDGVGRAPKGVEALTDKPIMILMSVAYQFLTRPIKNKHQEGAFVTWR